MTSNPIIKAAAISDIDGYHRKIQVLFNNTSLGVVYIRAQDSYSLGYRECVGIYSTYPKYTTFNDTWIDNPSSLNVMTYSCDPTGWEDCSLPDCQYIQGSSTIIYSIPVKPYNISQPGTPVINVTTGDTEATITWNAVTDPTGGEVWAYYFKIINKLTTLTVTEGYVPNNEKSKIVLGVQNGITHSAEVYAISDNGINGPVGYKDFTPGIAQKYNCNTTTHLCEGPFVTGTYDSLAACQTACVATTLKWKCTDPTTNTCSQGSDSTYTYNSQAECQATTNCQPGAGTGIGWWNGTTCFGTTCIPNKYMAIGGGIFLLMMMKK